MLLISFLALPVALAQVAHKRAITPDVLSKLRYFSEYSAEGYCAENYVPSATELLSCPGPICPQLQSNSIQIVKSFLKIGKHQTTGLVLVDHSRDSIVITFRGTVSDEDWDTDVDFVLDSANDICEGCSVHSGFLESWTGVRDIVLGAWSGLQKEYRGYKTVVTGHSLGGGIANLCAADLAKNITSEGTLSLFTYGSPRVGNPVFANFIETTFGNNNYRVTHLNDPVPRLPGRILGFTHPGPEYHITSPHIPDVLSASYATLTAPKNLVVAPNDILVLPGAESPAGNLGYRCADIHMHDAYFVPIAGCVPDNGTPLLKDFAEDICYLFDICCNAWFGWESNSTRSTRVVA